MNVTIVHYGVIPVNLYGGTERVIWYLGEELSKLNHNVTFLVGKNSYCSFADVKFINTNVSIWEQIPENTDIVHFQHQPVNIHLAKKPYVVTMHGNTNDNNPLNINTIFVSKNHAERFGSSSFVYNGLNWNDYSKPTFKKENYFHFLGNAAWRVKNVKGAISIVKSSKQNIKILGGHRFNFKMGIRFTFTSRASFYGMVGGARKNNLLNKSKGLIFPVLWHEPFGLAITESLFYGCPVFGTPYGSLPELVNKEVGFLSIKKNELVNAVKNANLFSQKKCNEYVTDVFNSKKMALNYLNKYTHVLNGENLNAEEPVLQKISEQKFLPWTQ